MKGGSLEGGSLRKALERRGVCCFGGRFFKGPLKKALEVEGRLCGGSSLTEGRLKGGSLEALWRAVALRNEGLTGDSLE